MADYAEHVRVLILFLLAILLLFTVTYTYQWTRLWNSALITTVIVVGIILILARFGGDLGRTG